MSVRSSWVFAVLLSGVLFLFAGCGDSSDVGLGVGPDSLEGGQPRTLNINPELDTATMVPQTGRNLAPSLGGTPTWRFLVGRVNDPLTGGGVVKAEGYMDVRPPSPLPDRISSASPDSIAATLRLKPTYVHGDTSSSVDIEVLELTKDAEMGQARADTSFPAGSFATDGPVSISPNPDDSLVTIELSDAWVEDRLTDLQQDSLEAFSGFKLTTGSSEDAVVGFSANSASLRLLHRGDSTTADYNGSKVFTHVEQTSPPSPPTTSHRLLQDGVGRGLELNWNFDESPLDTLATDPLNRAQIFIPVDTTAMKAATPPSFVRPLPEGFRIIATRESAPSTPSCSAVRAAAFSERECVVPLVPSAAPGAALVSNNVAFPTFDRSFQRTRNGQPPVFEDVRLFIADREGTSGNTRSTIQPGLPTTLPILVATDGKDPGPPRATLTVTPL
ncbi:MAG: hypothetical protein ABEK75_06395 [Salinibacter sp.]